MHLPDIISHRFAHKCDPRFFISQKRGNVLRAWALAAAYLLYPVLFIALYPRIGEVVSSISVLPVAVAALLYRRKHALVASFVATAISTLLFYLIIGLRDPSMLLGITSARLVILVMLAWLLSLNVEMRERMRQDMQRRELSERALRESDLRYRMLFNSINDSMLIHDMDGHILKVNLPACDQLGYTPAQILGLNVYRLAGPSADQMRARTASLHSTQKVLFETSLTTRAGVTIPVEINACLIEYQGRSAVLSTARDIRQRKAIERSEQEQRVLAETLRDITADLTSTLELEEVMDRILFHLGRVIENDSVSIDLIEVGQARVMRHHGFTERGLGDWIDGSVRPVQEFYTLRTMAETRSPIVISDTAQDPRWVHHPQTEWVRSYLGAPIHIKGETIGFLNVSHCKASFFTPLHAERLQAIANYAAVAIQNARLYAEVQRLAMVDPLTGLYNRRGLFEFGQRELERSKRYTYPLAALMVDVDNFKQYNDSYCYAIGDAVLAEVALRCQDAVRKMDLVARFGGDEFIILLTDCRPEAAQIVAEHVRAFVEREPFITESGPLQVTVSIGIATVWGEDSTLNQLIHSSGQAAHQAKETGRNCIVQAQSTLQ